MSKKQFFIFGLVLLAISSIAYADQSCEVLDNDGTIDGLFCRNSEFKIRCFADVKYADGSTGSVFSGTSEAGDSIDIDKNTCYQSYSDCWTFGIGAVKPVCSFF